MLATDTTELLLDHVDNPRFADALYDGWTMQFIPVEHARQRAYDIQRALGLGGTSQLILSPPENQHKLGMAEIPSYGITLYHEKMKTLSGLLINSCPKAGDCRSLCVVENSFGGLPEVQLSWRWRTELLVSYPIDFFTLLGYWIRKAVLEHNAILMRPNVDSDLEWHKIVPALVDGSIFGYAVSCYDYTKNEQLLYEHMTGHVTPNYRVSYSWNESSGPHRDAVTNFLALGGSVAVVTDRRHNQPMSAATLGAALPFEVPADTKFYDADKGDDWMLNNGPSVGDLSLKPRTRRLREFGEQSDFVVSAYHPRLFWKSN